MRSSLNEQVEVRRNTENNREELEEELRAVGGEEEFSVDGLKTAK